MIEHVIEVRAELSPSEIREANRPQKRHVNVLDARTDDYVSAAVAERSGLRNGEGCRVKKPGWRGIGNIRTADEIGTIHDWTPGSSDVGSHHGRQRHARLDRANRLNLP